MNYVKHFIYNHIIPVVGRLNVGKNKFVNVIYYHDIVKGEGQSFMQTNIEVFKQQMEYIAKNGYTTLRFDELDDKDNQKFEKKKVVIAFDDGWLSNYTEIFDFMKSLGIKYNIYLTISEIEKNKDYLTWDLVRKMHDSGWVGFGVHTFTHPHVADMKDIDPQLEFVQANEIFQKELGYEPLDFCYPYGSCSEKSHEYLTTQTNYKRIYTSTMMYSYEQNGRIIFGRNGISNDETFGVFKAKLNGYFNVWETIIH
ncbi:MAG: polysaccharide deacetylase family protein [Bacteroidales bacterium]|nr:polysaccharide deacetylase family protein [Bacteroidales bacterium]